MYKNREAIAEGNSGRGKAEKSNTSTYVSVAYPFLFVCLDTLDETKGPRGRDYIFLNESTRRDGIPRPEAQPVVTMSSREPESWSVSRRE